MGGKFSKTRAFEDGYYGARLSASLLAYLEGHSLATQIEVARGHPLMFPPSYPSSSSSASSEQRQPQQQQFPSSSSSSSFTSHDARNDVSPASPPPPVPLVQTHDISGVFNRGYEQGVQDALTRFEREAEAMMAHAKVNEKRYLDHIQALEGKLKELSD